MMMTAGVCDRFGSVVVGPCELLTAGEAVVPQLQSVLHSHDATVHEEGLRQDAH